MMAAVLFLLTLSGLASARHKKYFTHTGPAVNDCQHNMAMNLWTGVVGSTPLHDLYNLSLAPGPYTGAWVATMVSGGGWSMGKGQLSADASTSTISFDSGVNLTGVVSNNCSKIVWDNDSSWIILPPPITDVHIIAMNHLDVGYNGIPGLGLINNILNVYFQEYFPRAVAVAEALTARGGQERLVYTTHAFLVHLYLHCPVNMTLSDVQLWCPPADAVAAFQAAIKRGDVVWHAGAFNTEYENAFNAEMVDVQFQLAKDLADENGVARPTVVSLRDVPGTTRALIPHLVRNNITAISIGVNGGSPAPAMPNPGVWKDPASGTSVLYMQTGQGQGYPNNPGPDPVSCGGMCASSCVTFAGLSHALCWAFRTDNSGPPMDADEVIAQFDIARWQFIGANVYASTYENFTAALATVADQLPVVTGEVGDTWMTSTTADSWKMKFYREASRAYKSCLDSQQCDPHDPRVLGFTRLLAKLPEHTWGLPGVSDSSSWTNAQFATMSQSGSQAYTDALNSYTEQRYIATREGIRYLADHPLAAAIATRMAALVPSVPETNGLIAVAPSAWAASLKFPHNISLGFDGNTGAISRLLLGGVEWAGEANLLAQYVYKTFDDTDYAANPTCCYGEPNRQKVANPQSTVTVPAMTGLWVDSLSAPTQAVVAMTMPQLQHTYYGAPSALYLTVTADVNGSVDLTLQVFNKTATRLGEAHFFSFMPLLLSASACSDCVWLMDKLGSWVNPLDTVANGGLHQHGVSSGVAYASAANPNAPFFSIDTLDATVVNPATAAEPASMFPFPLTPLHGPVLGFDVQLLQNAFSTNTPAFTWEPDFSWRFQLRAA